MKRIIIAIIAILSIGEISFAQGLTGINLPYYQQQPLSLKPKQATFQTKKNKKDIAFKKANQMVATFKSIELYGNVNMDSLREFYTDSLTYAQEDSTTIAIVDTLNKSSPVKVLATGGISKIEDVQQSSGNLTVGLQFRLSKFKRMKKGNWIDPQYVYFMFNAKTATSSDSTSTQRTFLFPELSKRDFVVGYFWQFMKDDWNIGPVFEASLNKYSDTSNTHLFRSESFLLGAKIAKTFTISGLNIVSGFQLFPYYNIINVDPKYWDSYTSMVGARNSHPTFHNVGLQAMIQVDKAFIFCNMKYILNKSDGNNNPDFVRFVYTIGGMVSL